MKKNNILTKFVYIESHFFLWYYFDCKFRICKFLIGKTNFSILNGYLFSFISVESINIYALFSFLANEISVLFFNA